MYPLWNDSGSLFLLVARQYDPLRGRPFKTLWIDIIRSDSIRAKPARSKTTSSVY